MPAYFDTGFSVREPMWHGQGLVLDEYPTDWATAREKGGLGWEPVELTPYVMWPIAEFACPHCFGTFGKLHLNECPYDGEVGVEVLPAGAIVVPEGIMLPSAEHKAIARRDTKLVLGVKSDEYSTIYHGAENEFGEVVSAAEGRASMEAILDAFRGADGGLRFETAGSCREGRQVWALLYLDEPYTIPGDTTEHLPFLALLNNHAGGGCSATPTQVRVVCWNTYQAASAEGDRLGRKFTFRHVGDVATRIEEAKATIAGLRSETEEYIAMSKELMELRVDDSDLGRFLQDFLPNPAEHGEVVSDRVQGNVEKARAMFKHIYLDSVTTENIRGTGFGLLQASTEYLDHARAFRSQDTYMGRSILGHEPAKDRALLLVHEHAH